MKKTLTLFALVCVALAGCRTQSQYNDVVNETYIHKYGVPVTKADWENQGQDGQTVALHKNGVTVTTSYSKGIVNGPTTYSFPNSSTIHRIKVFSNGQLISKIENYPSGVPMQEEVFEQNLLASLTRWYEDGTPQANETYQDSFLLAGEYRTPLNVVESRIIDGHGMRINRSNDGEFLWKETVQNGYMIERVTYYSNGDPATVTPFENGVVHGACLTFLPGGVPNTVEQWNHGVQDGITVLYLNGEKVAEVSYVRGNKQGTEYRYKDGDLLVEEVNWKNNVRHGPRKLYINGEIKTEWYHEGEVVSRNAFERMNMPRTFA